MSGRAPTYAFKRKIMLNSKKKNCLALLIVCGCLSSCESVKTNRAGEVVSASHMVDIPIESAIALIWELQRLYVVCGKLEPENAEALSRQYRDSNLVEFEKFLPIDQNPYVAVISNSDVFDHAYLKGDPEIKIDALRDCKTEYPRLLEKFTAQAEALKRALKD